MAVADVSSKRLQDLISLEGRVAVVTGAASGIGFAVAWRLAEAKALVIVSDLDEQAARTAAKKIGAGARPAYVDGRASESVSELAEKAVTEYGRLDIWVNNAGIYPFDCAMNMTPDQWQQVIDLNLNGVFYGSREAAKRMGRIGEGGVIINLASTAAYRADAPAHYVAAKHGVKGLTKSLAVEFASYGVRVLALAPTLIQTEGIADKSDEIRRRTGGENAADKFARLLPLGRAGLPDDVARVALFCASDLSLFMTGSTLPVDAGKLAL